MENAECLEVRRRFDLAMYERVNAEDALGHQGKTMVEKEARFEKAKTSLVPYQKNWSNI
ncbi:MAG: hypothetical protein JWQ42_4606 [Edaphobacter sp.]|nr:hypothetical protein [Edaphobacter sp.]